MRRKELEMEMPTMETEPRRMVAADEALVANPNLDRTWAPARGGKIIEFPPMEQIYIPTDLAEWLLSKASQAWEQSRQDAVDTNRLVRKLKSSDNYEKRAQAERYLNSDGSPKSVAWKRPPLVDLNSVNGQNTYKEALKEREDLANRSAPKHTERICDATEAAANTVQLEKPLNDWSVEKLRVYIKEHFGKWEGAQKQPSLYVNAMRLFDLQRATLEAAGNIVEEV